MNIVPIVLIIARICSIIYHQNSVANNKRITTTTLTMPRIPLIINNKSKAKMVHSSYVKTMINYYCICKFLIIIQ